MMLTETEIFTIECLVGVVLLYGGIAVVGAIASHSYNLDREQEYKMEYLRIFGELPPEYRDKKDVD